MVPGDDLGTPGGEGAAEPVDLWEAGFVLEVSGELADQGVGVAGVGSFVDLANCFFGVPEQADFSVGVACLE